MLNGTQEKLILAYFQGGNAKEVKEEITMKTLLRTIKEIEQEPINKTEEEQN